MLDLTLAMRANLPCDVNKVRTQKPCGAGTRDRRGGDGGLQFLLGPTLATMRGEFHHSSGQAGQTTDVSI